MGYTILFIHNSKFNLDKVFLYLIHILDMISDTEYIYIYIKKPKSCTILMFAITIDKVNIMSKLKSSESVKARS
jgi:hypothetical protein